MATLKVTYLFDMTGGGWSETYYVSSNLDLAGITQIRALADHRRTILSPNAIITHARVADVAAPKKGSLIEMNKKGQAQVNPGFGNKDAWGDHLNLSIVAPIKTAAGVRRSLTLGGIADDWCVRDGAGSAFVLTDEAKEKVRKWRKAVVEAPFSILMRVRNVAGDNAPKKIQSIEKSVFGSYQITTSDAVNYMAGDRLAFTGLKGNNLANLKGIHKALNDANANSFRVNTGPRADLGDPTYIPLGFVSKVVYDYVATVEPLDECFVSTRKRGRPFSRHRGRRSVRK